MGETNPIRTLGYYSIPNHKGYRNTIELPEGNNVVPLRSDTIREIKRLHLFQFSLHGKACNWLERLLAGSISTWEDLTTSFLAQFFPSRRTAKLRNDILMFQQHQGESISEAWTHVPSTSDCRLIELENQVQRLMEAHLAPKQPIQVNKITSSCEICSGPHDTQYCMENPKQAFVDYASSRTDEAGGKWYTFKPEQNNLGDTYNPSWKSHPNLRMETNQVTESPLNYREVGMLKDISGPELVALS
ncbi:MAK10-like protein [Tanacetum coccineum]